MTAKTLFIISGPCSAESKDQVLTTCEALASLGISMFRAGVWKPRTKPGCFEGMGEKALPWLKEIEERTGCPVATEVATARQAELAIKNGLSVLWIGARTTGNPFSVQEIANYLASLSERERNQLLIFIKNPISPDVELWAGAYERIKRSGVKNLGIIHRGFTPTGPSRTRNTPNWSVAIEMHRRYPNTLFICDPSHMTGDKKLIAEYSQTAINIGFDGLMLECHCNPESALSDRNQQLTPSELETLLEGLKLRNESDCGGLDILREEIDNIDSQILDLLSVRMKVSKKIGEVKKNARLPIMQPERCAEVIGSRISHGVKLGLNEKFVGSIYGLIHDESVSTQISLG